MKNLMMLILLGLIPWTASAQILDWQGGAGTWDTVSANWSEDGQVTQPWPASGEGIARFGEPGDTASLQGQLQAAGIIFDEPGSVISVNYNSANRLTLTGNISGPGAVRFAGGILGGSERYQPGLMDKGLHFTGGDAIEFAANLTASNGNASQILTVTGQNTVVTYSGTWTGDGSNAFPHLFLREGGRLILGGQAELNFVNDAYFTRQLWVSGDGTGPDAGVVEFAEGFVADLSEGGTVTNGLGSIRLNNATVITRSSQGIPVHFRPRPGNPDGPQTNGHFVFENNPGKWVVASNPQTYAGGVWIRASVEIHTETDLTHIGVTEDDNESSFPYRAGNAFQTNQNNLTITKTGPGELILAGEQAYRPGTEMVIGSGTVRFETDPAAGYFHNHISSPLNPAGPDLQVAVQENGRAVFSAPGSRIQSLQNDGLLEIVLGADAHTAAVQVQASANLGGTLHLSPADGHTLIPGTTFTLIAADSVTGDFQRITAAHGVQFDVEVFADRVEATVLELQGSIQEILYDNFANLDNWLDLSRAVTWESTPEAETVFQITPDGDADHVLNLNDASRNVGMWGENDIRTFSCLDFVFPEPVTHRTQTLTVEFRARWDSLSSTEGNRIGLTLVHDYPEEGLDLTPDEKYNDFSKPWWGRPAYQLRIRSGGRNIPGSTPILMYGGGHDPDGEFEFNATHWMPGFSSAPGGTAPGDGDPYPENGWVTGSFSPASVAYKQYRYVVRPHAQELWVNEADDGETWEMIAEMPLPLEEDAPAEAPLYRYFETFEGLRLYFRSPGAGRSNVYIDYVRITVESHDLPTQPDFNEWVAANLPGISENGPLDDPFNHGVTNLQRYALGYSADTSPAPENRPRLLPAAEPAHVSFRFQRPEGGRADVNYIVSITADLTAGDWQVVDEAFWTLVPIADGLETVEIEIDPGQGPVFAALEVELINNDP